MSIIRIGKAAIAVVGGMLVVALSTVPWRDYLNGDAKSQSVSAVSEMTTRSETIITEPTHRDSSVPQRLPNLLPYRPEARPGETNRREEDAVASRRVMSATVEMQQLVNEYAENISNVETRRELEKVFRDRSGDYKQAAIAEMKTR